MEIDYKSSLHSHRRYKKNKKKLTSNKVCESSNLGEKKQKKMIGSILGKIIGQSRQKPIKTGLNQNLEDTIFLHLKLQ